MAFELATGFEQILFLFIPKNSVDNSGYIVKMPELLQLFFNLFQKARRKCVFHFFVISIIFWTIVSIYLDHELFFKWP